MKNRIGINTTVNFLEKTNKNINAKIEQTTTSVLRSTDLEN